VDILIIFILLFVVSTLFTGLYRSYAIRKDLLDHPNHRSSHTQPTPRGGGVVFCVLFLCCAAILPHFHFAPADSLKVLGVPALMVAILGYLDDIHSLPAKLRFAIQMAAAIIFLYLLEADYSNYLHGWLIALHSVGFILMIVGMVWSTNLYNFMDGTDGIASVEAITIFGIGGVLLWMQGAHQLAFLSWSLVASVCGFLVWNWPKAKIFMGDVASSFLGFLVIPFALFGYFEYGLSIFVWFILYLAFTMDATLTLFRRLLHREKIYEAHKLHAYQRLHQAGLSHRQVLYVMIGLNLIFSGLSLLAMKYSHWLLEITLISVFIYLCFYAFVEIKKPMYGTSEEVVSV
jgi:Fuc2NAc and GlcNAc transferase